MRVDNTNIEDVKLIHQFRHDDERGAFIKPFHDTDFKESGIDFQLKESFYSTSVKNVIRGMHFHAPPHEHSKIVFCTAGCVLDVALDLRKDVATYGQFVTAELCFQNNQALYIPEGFAHGFISLTKESTLFYLVSGEYNKDADGGVRYDSFGLDWPVQGNAILSPRDLEFPSLQDFKSPF
jgi:dTDP-4-dehydrorhamnose 3,5-epimerase